MNTEKWYKNTADVLVTAVFLQDERSKREVKNERRDMINSQSVSMTERRELFVCRI